MAEDNSIDYLDRLLTQYGEKLQRFRRSFTLLLVGTLVFFFLIFVPYITLIGNQADCPTSEPNCRQTQQLQVEQRVTEVTSNWGNIPVSTSELVIFFPTAVACGFIATTSQLNGLIRLRRAIDQQINSSEESCMDSTLLAPVLIDPKHSLFNQLVGALVISFPAAVVGYSINLLLRSLTSVKGKLPYFQAQSFYYGMYTLTAVLTLYGLAQIGLALVRNQNGDRT
ncbi:MAG: hypothetical protein AAF821_14560 [Cyanobacteria bacterium P01_D01_bin.156]